MSNPVGTSALGHGKALSRMIFAVPFFLGAALYLSVIFAVFSALPLIFVHLRLGRMAGILASMTNISLVFALSGRVNAAVFFVLAVVLAAAVAECVKLKLKVEWNVVISVIMMLLVSTLLLVSYSHRFKVDPIQKVDAFVAAAVQEIATNVEKYKASSTISSQDLDKFLVDPEMTKRNILYELPSAITISLLVLTIGNILLLVRLNLYGWRGKQLLAPDFFKTWKTPDHMVWPALAAGFALVVEVPGVSDVALNVFKILMAIYAIQGLAIVNSLFDLWGVKGVLRPIGYTLAVAILLPLVISLGFFDLWFDFRNKFKT